MLPDSFIYANKPIMVSILLQQCSIASQSGRADCPHCEKRVASKRAAVPCAEPGIKPSTTPALALLPHLRPTRAGVHGSYQGELGWEGEGTLGAADGNHLVLHGVMSDLRANRRTTEDSGRRAASIASPQVRSRGLTWTRKRDATR